MAKYQQGYFKPKFPEKYKGDPTNVIFRSSWELKVMMDLDYNPNIVERSSEETIIPYLSKVDRRYHRYFVDFMVKVKEENDQIKTLLLEIKPYTQTQQPKKPEKITKTYKRAVIEYARNVSKWEAAKEYCKKRGWQFEVLTEKELFKVK